MKRFVLFILMMWVALGYSFGQEDKKKEEELKQLIESRHFQFSARSVTPMSGGTINLTSEYELIVDSMNVEAWLPFYGRAYQTDYGSTEGGIKFKEKAKVLDIQKNEKKQTYEIRIEVDTDKDSYKIFIRAGFSGYASMDIISTRRQSVSYYGTIEPLKE